MKRKKAKKNKGQLIFSAVLVLLFATIVTINDFGLIKLIELKKTKYDLQSNIYVLSKQQKKLNKDITELQTNSEQIEKIAREKFLMAKPGEKIFRVIQYKKINK
mgnify:CR=1 FL=1|tara:strand:+ start:356 stop:667 length:312 start_codon:yes stop_codon:yes gene_type:complete